MWALESHDKDKPVKLEQGVGIEKVGAKQTD